MTGEPRLTFTMTSSRRPELFRRTMDSFLANCLDLDLIDRFIVGDDRTDPAELDKLRAEYPQLEIVSCPRPGQGANLNMVFGMVETEFFVHWEDDWETVQSGHFIRDALQIASLDDRIRNVVFRGWSGVYVKEGPLEFRGHVQCRLMGRDATWKNDFQWFGYSLNPSLQHLPTVKRLGAYKEAPLHRFFDRPQARRYKDLGYLRTNLMSAYVVHIGEQTSQWR